MSKVNEKYNAQEAKDRTEAALRAAFNAPHKTYEESKLGKRKAPPSKNLSRSKKGQKNAKKI